jgi:hypothetical protein
MPTYTLIQPAVVVGSGGAATIDFSSIPATYTDLILKYSIRQSNATPFSTMQITLNGSSSTFTGRYLEGDGATAGSATSPARFIGYLNASTSTANTFSNSEIYFPNYAGSTNKSFSIDYAGENNATTSYMGLLAQLWSTTSAITSISLVPSTGTILQHSTAYLYGVSNA